MRKGTLKIEASLTVPEKSSGPEVFHEVVNALQSVRTESHIKIKINDIAIQMEKEHSEEAGEYRCDECEAKPKMRPDA
jgi:hypothetical protein